MYCMNGVLFAAFILNAVVTYAGGVGSFGETNVSQSKAFPTLVTPAPSGGCVIFIWAVIFIGEGVFAVAQLCTRRFNFADKEEVRTIAPWFLSVCVFQALWTVAFAQPLSSEGRSTWAVWLSLGLMLALWASLYGPPAPPPNASKQTCRRALTLGTLSHMPGSCAWQRCCGCKPASSPTRRGRAGVAGPYSTYPSSCMQAGPPPHSSSMSTLYSSPTRRARRATISRSSLRSCRWCAGSPTLTSALNIGP